MRIRVLDTDSADLSLTPFIDVMFQLLIFFLVATRFDQEERELDAILPQATEAAPMSGVPKELIVNVDKDGRYLVMRHELSESELRRRLRQFRVNNSSNYSVLIRGDERAAWRSVARVMGLCNEAKIDNYRVAVLQEVLPAANTGNR